MVPFSILDLCPISEEGSAAEAFRNSRDLAQHAERWGYERFWVAEHHNMPGVASAAAPLVIGHIAEGTKTIRVGSGGVMLPNHSPLVVAEQFGTLASIFPGRIDLGLGRAPGTDRVTTLALRRDPAASADRFPQDVQELQAYFRPARPGQIVRAVPGSGLGVPIWLLGSSLFSAQLAAELGLPFAFASHFAPDLLMQALSIYRSRFQPSDQLDRPYAMAAICAVAAGTDAEARFLFTSLQQFSLSIRRGMPGRLQPPVEDFSAISSPEERAMIDAIFRYAVVGSPDSMEQGLRKFIASTRVDELMVTANIFDHEARLKSFEIIANVRSRLV